MKCNYCGFENAGDAKFCVKCGKEIVIQLSMGKDTRYEKQYSLPENLYNEKLQLILCNGGIYVGNVTKRVIAQFKIKNLSEKVIKAVQIVIDQKDPFQKNLKAVLHNYIDLNIGCNQYFGEGIPIELDLNTREISMKISSIVYENGELLNDIQMEWITLPKQTLLIDEISKEAFYQYQSEFGKVKYHPVRMNHLILCACGNIYEDTREICPECTNRFEILNNRLNQEELELEYQYQLACKQMENCQEYTDYLQCAKLFDALGDYQSAVLKKEECLEKSETVRKQMIKSTENLKKKRVIMGIVLAIVFAVIGGYAINLGNSNVSKTAETTQSDGIYIPGTYTGHAEGMGGDIQVRATFDANRISKVEIDGPYETSSIGGAALSSLKSQILEAQSANIDGVSGATITSNAVKEAMKECIESAKK